MTTNPVPVPPPFRPRHLPPLCSVCDDAGMVQKAVSPDHPDYSRVYVCFNPDCDWGRYQAECRGVNRKVREKDHEQFSDYLMKDFSSHTDGKSLAIAAAWLMIQSAGRPFSHADIVEAAGDEAQEQGLVSHSLVLFGENGVGKTSLAAAICNQIAKLKRREDFTRIVRFKRVAGEWEATYKQGSEMGWVEAMQPYFDIPLLVLDEVTLTSDSNKTQKNTLEEIVRVRNMAGKATVLTTNYTQTELTNTFGTLAGSIIESWHWIEVKGKILRGKANSAS